MGALLDGDSHALMRLLAAGAEANVAFGDRLGRTPLMIAALRGDVRSALILLEHSDPDRKDQAGMTALMIACEHGHALCSKAIAPVSHVNLTDKDGRTALMLAAHYGHLGCIEALAAFNADSTLKDLDGRNALAVAIIHSHDDCALWLCKLPGHDDGDKQGVTPLMHACMSGRHEVVNALAERVDLDQVAIDGHGATALSLAAYNGHTVCVKILLSAGANPDVADRAGMTALMKAAIGRDPAFASLQLLAEVADPRVKDSAGRTASDYAMHRKYEDRAVLLDSRCAVLDERDALATASSRHGRSAIFKNRL